MIPGDPRFSNRLDSDDLESRILRDRPHLIQRRSIRSSLIAPVVLILILSAVVMWMWQHWNFESPN